MSISSADLSSGICDDSFLPIFQCCKDIVDALCVHGTTSEEIAGNGFLCIVNLTYLNSEFLAANGKLFRKAGASSGR